MAAGDSGADFDGIVGGGTGNNVATAAAENGLDTALVEPGPLGWTCPNRGCNPSKMLIRRANVAETVHAHSTLSRALEAAFRDVPV